MEIAEIISWFLLGSIAVFTGVFVGMYVFFNCFGVVLNDDREEW